MLWKETDTITATEPLEGHQLDFEWLIGPYPELLECQVERNALKEVILLEATRKHAAAPHVIRKVGPDLIVVSGSLEIVMIRLLCVPDWVNPRKDALWQ